MIEINRHVGSEQGQLFCFYDVSKEVYATSVYLKTMVEGKPKTNLIFSKQESHPWKSYPSQDSSLWLYWLVCEVSSKRIKHERHEEDHLDRSLVHIVLVDKQEATFHFCQK